MATKSKAKTRKATKAKPPILKGAQKTTEVIPIDLTKTDRDTYSKELVSKLQEDEDIKCRVKDYKQKWAAKGKGLTMRIRELTTALQTNKIHVEAELNLIVENSKAYFYDMDGQLMFERVATDMDKQRTLFIKGKSNSRASENVQVI